MHARRAADRGSVGKEEHPRFHCVGCRAASALWQLPKRHRLRRSPDLIPQVGQALGNINGGSWVHENMVSAVTDILVSL